MNPEILRELAMLFNIESAEADNNEEGDRLADIAIELEDDAHRRERLERDPTANEAA